MVNVFNSEIASKIDMRKTIANGKEVFLLYQPLVEKRLKQLSKIPINSASIVVCSNSSGLKSTDSKLIDRLSWNNDQIALFIENIMNIKSFDPLIGEYLKLKCFYRLSDDAIARRINVSFAFRDSKILPLPFCFNVLLRCVACQRLCACQ